MLACKTKYRVAHTEIYLFSLFKNNVSESTYPKKNIFMNFEKGSTGRI